MKQEDILKQVIKQAEKNGYKLKGRDGYFEKGWLAVCVDLKFYYAIIFSHEFCKAFFGEGECVGDPVTRTPTRYPLVNATDCPSGMALWQYHIQQLAVAEDRLEYLKLNLK